MQTATRTYEHGVNGAAPYNGLFSMPGYQVYEYQLVLAIPDTIKDRIRKLRQQFSEQYNLPVPRNSAVMIPLVKFRQRQLLEEKMRSSLHQLVMGWRPFTVNLKDYKSMPTHSIYIPVTSKSALQQCGRELKSMQHLLRPDTNHNPFFPQEQQLIIAAKLPPGIYEKAWQQYAYRHFNAQFMVDACLLLKRKSGGQHWQILQRMELKDMPVGVKQGMLFA
ncbi:2'-5' RNA ligase family protein [Flavihumibacter sp.]|uniref:2'-5' RNA ligase family protein n=1 Tax=Flavihumibacter sp. TaxID=1913981 RepID=UPI002FCA8EC9